MADFISPVTKNPKVRPRVTPLQRVPSAVLRAVSGSTQNSTVRGRGGVAVGIEGVFCTRLSKLPLFQKKKWGGGGIIIMWHLRVNTLHHTSFSML